ncbi:MAG: helix-turn-helix transcriptional regulator [Phycisphaerales bacterium]|nr:helix-turn-helix transcriptional regulator [Phycisphaerales bacterium]
MSLRSPEFSAVILRHVMNTRKLTQAQISRMTDRDPSYITKVLNGECGLPTDALQSLALQAGIPLPQLVIEAQLSDKTLPKSYRRFLEKARDAIGRCWEAAGGTS